MEAFLQQPSHSQREERGIKDDDNNKEIYTKNVQYYSGVSAQPEEAMDTSEGGVTSEEKTGDSVGDVLTWLLGQLLDSYVSQAHPNVRQVSQPFPLHIVSI